MSESTPTAFKHLEVVIEEVYNPGTAKALNEAEASVLALDELRKKLCQLKPVEKRRWRFW
jgi:hypothetical protein